MNRAARPGPGADGVRWTAAATAVVALALLAVGSAAVGPARTLPVPDALLDLLDLVPVGLGWLVVRGAPRSPVGPALAWTGAAIAGTRAVEVWAGTAGGPAPWAAAEVLAPLADTVWPWQLLGFLGLVLVFPDGLLAGRLWRAVALAGPVAAGAITLTQTVVPAGEPTASLLVVVLPPMALLLATLLVAVAGVGLRFRRGGPAIRAQLRWLLLSAGSVPVLLAAGWVGQFAGLSESVAYAGFLLGILVLVPCAVTVAVLRHDLFDIDRLVSGTVSGAVTAGVSALVFAAVVVLAGPVLAPTGWSSATAAFVTALCLLPVHHRVRRVVGRVTDRERTVALGAVRGFVERVRTSAAEPEEVEDVLRRALGDPGLRLALQLPGAEGPVDLWGVPLAVDDAVDRVVLRAQDAEVGALLLARTSTRRRRLATEAVLAARLPIEVSRLRVELRASLADVTAGRARLVAAASVERRRLERDLHDGAQQRVVAVGMQLRSLQHRLGGGPGGPDVSAELDRAVGSLEATVAELRRVAHGLRPSRLDDGLAAALDGLAADSPLPVQVSVRDVVPGALGETVETTVFFVAAEAVANAWKHSGARSVSVRVHRVAGRTTVEVCDDGIGGVDPVRALTALRDRVGSVGGRLDVVSPPGGGTRVSAVFPCG